MKKNEKHNRRKFLSLSLLTGPAMMTHDVKAESKAINEETVMLLTPDGKLVEVKRNIVQKAKSGGKVTNQEILKWINPSKTKS